MARKVIDCRVIEGQTLFRVYSENTKAYVTQELSEEQLIHYLLRSHLRQSVDSFFVGIDFWIDEAKKDGSSDKEVKTDLQNSWRKFGKRATAEGEQSFLDEESLQKNAELAKFIDGFFKDTITIIDEMKKRMK